MTKIEVELIKATIKTSFNQIYLNQLITSANKKNTYKINSGNRKGWFALNLKKKKKKKKKNTLSPVKKFLANTQLSEFRFNQFYYRGFVASIDLLLIGKELNNSMHWK